MQERSLDKTDKAGQKESRVGGKDTSSKAKNTASFDEGHGLRIDDSVARPLSG